MYSVKELYGLKSFANRAIAEKKVEAALDIEPGGDKVCSVIYAARSDGRIVPILFNINQTYLHVAMNSGFLMVS